MNTFERVSQVEGQNRTEMLERVLANQKTAETRLSSVERKIAFYAGIGVVIGCVASPVISKVITLIK